MRVILLLALGGALSCTIVADPPPPVAVNTSGSSGGAGAGVGGQCAGTTCGDCVRSAGCWWNPGQNRCVPDNAGCNDANCIHELASCR